MAEEKLELLAARALLPAIVIVSAVWLVDMYGVQSSAFNFVLLACSYLLGAGTLLYVERGMKAAKGAGFYSAFVGCAAFGAAIGMAVIGAPLQSLLGFAGLPALMFVLPAGFELVMGMVKRVHSE